MSIKNKVTQVFTAGNGAGNLTSSVFDIRYNYGFAVQWNITGSAIDGAAKVQVSLDQVVWFDIDSDAVVAASSVFSNFDAIYYAYARLAWVNATGTNAAVSAYISIKGA